MRGRQSAAMLRAIGLESLVAGDAVCAVRTAIALAAESLPAARTQILRDRDRLFGRSEPIRALEEHLLSIAKL